MPLLHRRYIASSRSRPTTPTLHPPTSGKGFYFGLALLCCAIVMAGFVPVYYRRVLQDTASFPIRPPLHAAMAILWILLFTAWVLAGYLNRHRSERYKRLMMATIAMSGTPVARIELITIHQQPLLVRAVGWPRPDADRLRPPDAATPPPGNRILLLLAMQVTTIRLMENEA